MLTAAMRSKTAARLEERLVLELSKRPPEILLPGARLNHEVKCLAEAHLRISSPHSATKRSTVYGPNPWICATSALS